MITLRTDALDEACRIRQKVFVEEQGFNDEFDEIDTLPNTIHLTLFENDKALGCARIFPKSRTKETSDTWVFGRLAVLPEERGRQLGTLLLQHAERLAYEQGGRELILHAQCRVVPFYENSDYRSYGSIELDEHVEHIWMRKQLPEAT